MRINLIHEILEITNPSFTFSPEPSDYEVMKWTERKQKEILDGQKPGIMSMFKI